MKRLTLSIAVLSLLALPYAAQSASILYTVRDADDHLVAINNTTLQQTAVGPLGVPFEFGGLAYNPNSNTLYMIGGDVNPALYTVNRATGAATLVGSHGVGRLFGLDYDSRNNVLYASQYGVNPALYTLNPATGAATLVGNLSGIGLGGLAYNATTDVLLGMTPSSGELFAINRATADTTLLSDGPGVDDNGLAFDLERGLVWAIDAGGNLFSYDPNANYARTTRLSDLGRHDGLAFVIPEPSGGALLLGSVLCYFIRRLPRSATHSSPGVAAYRTEDEDGDSR